MNLEEKTDEELVIQILDSKTTDRRACQELLYDRYIDKIYSKCLLICKEPEAAKDIAQDVFIIVFTKLSTFRFESPFFGWIYKIAHYECLTYLRKKNRLNFDNDEVDKYSNELVDNSYDYGKEDQISRLNIAFDQLSDINRTVMILKYKEGKAIKEIAEMLEVGESAIKMRIKRSKLFIQDLLITSNYE